MKSQRYLFLFLVLVIQSHFAVHAQENDVIAHFTANNGTPLIGEPIDLLLTIDVPNETIVELPEFSQDWPPFTVREIGEVTTVTSGTRTTYQQHLIVVLWEPGEYQTPQTVLEYQLPNASDRLQTFVQPANFVAKSVLDPNDFNLRPPKPPISMAYISPLVTGAVILVGCCVAGFVWVRYKRRHLSGLKDAPQISYTPAQYTLSLIKRAAGADLSASRVFATVSDALRGYIHGRFGIEAMDMTTEEILGDLKEVHGLSLRRQQELASILEQSDLVKFARVQPSALSAEKALMGAQRWVIAVEQEYFEETV